VSSSKGKILGWWKYAKGSEKCPKCHQPGAEVPKKGHPLSAFWLLYSKRDKARLWACTEGCIE